MAIQELITALFIAGAALFVGYVAFRRIRSFSPRNGCGEDCGCSNASRRSSTPR